MATPTTMTAQSISTEGFPMRRLQPKGSIGRRHTSVKRPLRDDAGHFMRNSKSIGPRDAGAVGEVGQQLRVQVRHHPLAGAQALEHLRPAPLGSA